jgi:hypothetical protein
MTYPRQVHDLLCPRGDFVACWACGLVQVNETIADVLGCGSFTWFVPVLWVSRVFCFAEQFPRCIPGKGCSRQVSFSLNFRKRKFEVLRVYIGAVVAVIIYSLPAASSI